MFNKLKTFFIKNNQTILNWVLVGFTISAAWSLYQVQNYQVRLENAENVIKLLTQGQLPTYQASNGEVRPLIQDIVGTVNKLIQDQEKLKNPESIFEVK